MLTINTKESVLAILNNPGGSTQKFPHSRIIRRVEWNKSGSGSRGRERHKARNTDATVTSPWEGHTQ